MYIRPFYVASHHLKNVAPKIMTQILTQSSDRRLSSNEAKAERRFCSSRWRSFLSQTFCCRNKIVRKVFVSGRNKIMSKWFKMNSFETVATILMLLIGSAITFPVEKAKDPDFLECSNRTQMFGRCSCSLVERSGNKVFGPTSNDKASFRLKDWRGELDTIVGLSDAWRQTY